MGGNCLKDCTTRRYAAEEYYIQEDLVLKKLSQLFPLYVLHPIASYRNKESFGDMDILISSEFITEEMIIAIVDEFCPKQMFKNGNCLSFEYKEFQIDLIATGEENYRASKNYFAYNDLGNLCGRLAHSIGLKLGHDGLTYNYMDGMQLVKNIKLYTNWADILPVLGLSYKRYAEGFDNLEDIFLFVVSSPLFRVDIFLLENRNHTSRVRDSKRKTYMSFLQWLEDGSYEGCESTKRLSKEEWLPYLQKNVKGFSEAYSQAQKEHLEYKKYKLRYNGKIVTELTGLTGRELGGFMQWVVQYYGEGLQKDICAMNPDCISSWVVHMYKKYSGKLDIVEFRA